MGITVDFIVKHIRPADIDAWAEICKPRGQGSLNQYLLDTLTMSQEDIDAVFNDWAKVAIVDINDTSNQAIFVKAAQEISQARWDTLYNTTASSIMFFTAPLIKELSFTASKNAGKEFEFSPHETIPLVVTITRKSQAVTVARQVGEANLAADGNGNCNHLDPFTEGTLMATASQSPEQLRRSALASSYAEQVFDRAGKDATRQNIEKFFGIKSRTAPVLTALAAASPSAGDLNALLNNVGAAPGSSTTVTVPAAPADGDLTLVQNVQTLDSYIATLTALVMYNNHPEPYNLGDKNQAAQFVTDLANARNFVVTGGTVKAVPMYLPMGEATTQTLNKSTTSADLHLDLLTALFGALNLPATVLTELDGILTEISDSLKSLQLSYESQTQTLNHFVSFYYLTPVAGSNPPINQMNVEFIYLQLAQSSWKASVGKSSVSHFTLNMTTTRTTATMSAGIVAANTSNIVSSLMALTGNDATKIADMTKMKGVKT